MKKLAFLLMAILIVTVSYAQKDNGQVKTINKRDAAIFLNKTNKIMRETLKEVNKHKVYTGGLVAAKKYQKKAIKKFNKGKFQAGVNNSYIARRLSIRAYSKNTHKKPPHTWALSIKENHLLTIQVTSQKIDKILNKTNKEKERGIDLADINDVVVPGADTDTDNSKDKNSEDN